MTEKHKNKISSEQSGVSWKDLFIGFGVASILLGNTNLGLAALIPGIFIQRKKTV
jgi:hypothetical protein